MQTSELTLLTHTASKHIVTTEGENLTTGEQVNKPIRGTGEYTIPTALNSMHQKNENLIKLIKILGLCLEK